MPDINNKQDKCPEIQKSSDLSFESKMLIIANACQEISQNIDNDKINRCVNHYLTELLKFNILHIGLFDEQSQSLKFQLVFENNIEKNVFSISLAEKHQPSILCFNNHTPLVMNNFDNDYLTQYKIKPPATLIENSATQSSIYWPLCVADKAIGILSLQSYQANSFTQSEQTILKILASVTAVSLNNAKTYKEVEKQKSSIIISDKHVQTISEIGKEINSTLNLETVLWTVYQHVNKLMDATVFGIGLYDPEAELIRVDLAMEKGQRYKPYTRSMKIKNQFPVWCIENKEVVYINDIRTDGSKYFEVNEYDTWEKVRVVLEDDAFSGSPLSLIYVPMMLNDKVYGFITVQTFAKNAYKKIHVDILRSIAGYTVNAIANARAHQELKLTQESLRIAKKETEKTAESKMRFLANMSHEIRTPMNIILGFMGVVLEHNQLTDDDHQHIQTAYTAARNLLVIIDDILDITKNESGKLTIEYTPFNLFQLLVDAGQLLSFQAEEKGLDYFFEYEQDLQQCFLGDPVRLNQIILNLAGNALKFTHLGSIKIKVESAKKTNTLRFSVIDTGIGIAKNKQSKIFEVFTQADTSTTRNFGGTGLGTTISRQLVEAMKGKIWVKSVLSQGSTFIFEVPLKPVAPSQVKVEHFQHTKKNLVERKLNILLAEDTLPNAVLMNVVLSKKGHRLTIVDDGVKALEAVKNNHFDLVLMDVQMPNMDGLSATKKIRALKDIQKKNIPIIAMTASALQEDRKACFEAGMNEVQTKPVNFSDLFVALNKLTH